MENNYIIAYENEWSKLYKLDLIDVSRRLEIKYDLDKNLIILPFINENYILNIKNKSIYNEKNNSTLSIDDSIILLNYLTYSNDYILNSNNYVTLKELPNGGSLFYPAFYKLTIQKLVDNFGYNIKEFENICLNLGGKCIDLGDKGFEFNLLPKINLCVAIWEGDDEISPNATILYNSSIQYLMHIETIIGLGMSLVDKIIFSSNKL